MMRWAGVGRQPLMQHLPACPHAAHQRPCANAGFNHKAAWANPSTSRQPDKDTHRCSSRSWYLLSSLRRFLTAPSAPASAPRAEFPAGAAAGLAAAASSSWS